MWSLGKLLFFLCIARSLAAELIYVSGYEKSDAVVSCPHAGYGGYEKYLCRDPCDHQDVLIRTTEGKRSRYSAHNDNSKRIFTTTISNLTFTDAGRYWCGVTRTGLDHYLAEVVLVVVPDSCCEQTSTVEGPESGSVSITCEYEPRYKDHVKYLCREAPPSRCLRRALVTSDSNHSTGRISLTDHKLQRHFTVTISGLTQEDGGSYLCGVHTDGGLDVFSAVSLEVKVSQTTGVAMETTTSSSLADKADRGVPHSLMVPVGVAAPLLLILTVALVLVCRKKRCKQQGDGVAMGRVTVDVADTGDSIYEVEDARKPMKQKPTKKKTFHEADDNSDDDAEYENVSATDNIYCNNTFAQKYHRGEMKRDTR